MDIRMYMTGFHIYKNLIGHWPFGADTQKSINYIFTNTRNQEKHKVNNLLENVSFRKPVCQKNARFSKAGQLTGHPRGGCP
jgi:hypothetical protein